MKFKRDRSWMMNAAEMEELCSEGRFVWTEFFCPDWMFRDGMLLRLHLKQLREKMCDPYLQ